MTSDAESPLAEVLAALRGEGYLVCYEYAGLDGLRARAEGGGRIALLDGSPGLRAHVPFVPGLLGEVVVERDPGCGRGPSVTLLVRGGDSGGRMAALAARLSTAIGLDVDIVRSGV